MVTAAALCLVPGHAQACRITACSSRAGGLFRTRSRSRGLTSSAASSPDSSPWHSCAAAYALGRQRGVRLRLGRGPLLVVGAGGPSGGLNKAKRPGGKEVPVLAPRDVSSIWANVEGDGSKTAVLLVHQVDTPGKVALVAVSFAYVGLVLLLPTFNVFAQVRPQSPGLLIAFESLALTSRLPPTQGRACCVQAFHKGVGPFLEHLTDPDFLHAVRCTCVS